MHTQEGRTNMMWNLFHGMGYIFLRNITAFLPSSHLILYTNMNDTCVKIIVTDKVIKADAIFSFSIHGIFLILICSIFQWEIWTRKNLFKIQQ